jgi:nucleoside phosphorylase
LLIVCALRLERLALRAGLRKNAAGHAAVIRTGMGARAAARAVTDALGGAAHRGAAVLATGFCAGLDAGMRPGDVVVADGPGDGRPLAAALTAAGQTVHLGRLAQSDHVVRGPERATLRATGAIAVDMESAAMIRAALDQGAPAVAAARVVVDTPDHELMRAGTLYAGITACRVLHDLAPLFLNWHGSAVPPLEMT